MNEIIKKLNAILTEIEALDDPTGDERARDLLGDAHYSIEECIEALERIEVAPPGDEGP